MSSATTWAGNFAAAPGDHAEPDRSAAGDDDDVVEGDAGALDGVQRAGQRLGERGVGRREVLADLVHQRVGRDRPCTAPCAPGVRALEAVDVVRAAHAVLAAQAVAALPARHDLLGDHPVADLDAPARPRPRSSSSTTSPTNSWPGITSVSAQAGRFVVAPELRGAVVALQVAGADADRLDADQRLARARARGPGPPRAGSPPGRGRRRPASWSGRGRPSQHRVATVAQPVQQLAVATEVVVQLDVVGV